jgi:hypothetical protein
MPGERKMPDEMNKTNLTIEILVKGVEPYIKEFGKDGIKIFNIVKHRYYMSLLLDPKTNHHDGLLKHMIKPENINSYSLEYVIESYVSDREDNLFTNPEIEKFCLDRLSEIASGVNPKKSLGIKDNTGPKKDFVVCFQTVCYLNYLLKTGEKLTKARNRTAKEFIVDPDTVRRYAESIKIPDVSAETLFTLATNPIPNFFSMAY